MTALLTNTEELRGQAELEALWLTALKREDHWKLLNQLIIRTIDALKSGNYTEFDAHTTSNCCHGIALLVRKLILLTGEINLESLRLIILKRQGSDVYSLDGIPKPILFLASLYALNYIGEIVKGRGRLTKFSALKKIFKVGTNFCRDLASSLQRYFSNLVAIEYSHLFSKDENIENICDIPISILQKYTSGSQIRSDNNGMLYSSSLFSMLLMMAYLRKSKATIALLNDLNCTEGDCLHRYLMLLRGDGKQEFKLIDSLEIELEEFYDKREPIVVFGACSFNDMLVKEVFQEKINPWISKFPNLVLAHETRYPQFPNISIDPNFCSDQIIPDECYLREILEKHSNIPGINVDDPSFCCFTHIFTSSLGQLMDIKNRKNLISVPYSKNYSSWPKHESV